MPRSGVQLKAKSALRDRHSSSSLVERQSMIRFKRGPRMSRLSNRIHQNSLRVHIVPNGNAHGQQAGLIPRLTQRLHAGSDVLVVIITKERNEAAKGP